MDADTLAIKNALVTALAQGSQPVVKYSKGLKTRRGRVVEVDLVRCTVIDLESGERHSPLIKLLRGFAAA